MCLFRKVPIFLKASLSLTIIFGAVTIAHAQQPPGEGEIWVNGRIVGSLKQAFNFVTNDGIIRIGPGVYKMAGTIKKDRVKIEGSVGTILDGVADGGKGAIVVRADDIVIENITCRNISVPDENGACIRHEGTNLTLRNVHFMDSESGILGWKKGGVVTIEDSRFERLGGGTGQAHAIYINGGELIIRRTVILSARDQAHGVKSRAERTIIENSIIASLEGIDSRLIDIPDGGRAYILDNLLVEGPNTANWQIASFGVEGQPYRLNSLRMENNMIITDRRGGSDLILVHASMPTPIITKNIIVGNIRYDWGGGNYFFDSRAELNLPPAPELPKWDPKKK
ncbi:hypothetical protein [Kordiimonas sp. SCSIO 12610]|uniref:hypothetical protein n=1 Tax=Kordiimonas sp. SCSIO 12610 TaxID=2829597 RepID=UPI00210A4832|nr:hypothetical protein [Kordiimonas sp. SCSIO 12610]UTW55136.1 hypothetical protein KFF44_15235 [Kordiimonas sp. SCSIO 12610]